MPFGMNPSRVTSRPYLWRRMSRSAMRSMSGSARTWRDPDSDVDDDQARNVDVVVVLRDDRHAERDRRRRDPGIVHAHPQATVAKRHAESRPRGGDALVDRYGVQRERRRERRQPPGATPRGASRPW